MKRIEYKTVWQAAVASWDSGGYGGRPPFSLTNSFHYWVTHPLHASPHAWLGWVGAPPPPFPTSWIRHCGSLDNVQRKSRQLFVLKVYLLREIQNLRIFKTNGGGRQRDNFSLSPPSIIVRRCYWRPLWGWLQYYVCWRSDTFYSVHYTKSTATSRP